MALQATIGGVTVPVLWPFTADKRINLRNTADFVVSDANNTLVIAENMTVVVTDTVLGNIFSGYVQTSSVEKLPGNPMLFKTISCKDYRYLADKRYFLGPDYTTPRLAGDIICDLHNQILSAEGVISAYAQRYDRDATTWGQGTLTGVSGATGNLQLSPAGSTVTVNEDTTVNFATGTLTNTASVNNQLQLASYTSLKFTGSAAQGVGSNVYNYRSIWSGSYTIVSGDVLMYDLFISTTSPAINGGIDLGFSDGTNLRDKNYADSLGISAHPGASTAQYASDQWYARSIPLTPSTNPLTGKIINTCMIALEGDNDGAYTLYAKNIRVMNGATTKVTFFSNTLTRNVGVSNYGYYNTSVSVVTVYDYTGQRVSSAYSLSAAILARDSLISWATLTQTQPSASSAAAKLPQIAVETSLDGGATWQAAISNQPIPGLLPGQSLSGVNLMLRETLALGGPNPELSPALLNVVATILPSYTATKSDVVHTDATSTDFGTGTLTNVTSASTGLQLTGNFRNWSSGDVLNCTAWAPAAENMTMNTTGGALSIRGESNFSPPNSNSWDMKAQFNFAGNWADFVAEIDIEYVGDPGCQYGLVYRTTFWGTTNNSYGYLTYLDSNGVHFARGTNASAGVFTLLKDVPLTLNKGEWYHLKVQAAGTTHSCYLNDVFMYSMTDSTFTAAGGFGARLYNNDTTTNTRHSGFYNNFGVQSAAFTGSRVTTAQSLAAASVVQASIIHWEAIVPDTASLLIETSIDGGATYQTCSNDSAIPGLSPGTSVASASLKIRQTLTTQNANATPQLTGLTTLVIGQYNVTTAQRISPALSLAPAGTCGATGVTWNAITPTGTSVLVDTSPDGTTWTNVATSGSAIPGLTTAPDPTIDDYTTNTAANYTSTFYTGGAATTATFSAGKLQLTGGANALYVWNTVTAKDNIVYTTTYQSDGGGLLLRYTDANNWYAVYLADSSASTNPGKAWCVKRVASTNTQIQAPTTINFTRGIYHTAKFSVVGSTLTFFWDGVQIFSLTDASLSASGKSGFAQATGTTFYQLLRAEPQGQSLAGLSEYTRVRLTSTDPRYTPVVTDLTLSARSLDIDNGAMIPSTSWAYSNTVSACIDDLTKRSNGWWGIRQSDKHLIFQVRNAQLAPWPISSANGNDLLAYTSPKADYTSASYRNKQYVKGGTQRISAHDQRIANGVDKSWQLTYPVAPNTVPVITVGNAGQTVGQGTTGFDFYYTESSNTINQDSAEIPPLDGLIIDVVYQGIEDVIVTSQSTTQQTLLAGYDGSTGIIENVETVSNLDQPAAQQLSDARIAQYGLQMRVWSYTTRRDGLAPGQIQYVFVPELSLNDVPFLITDVKQTLTEEMGVVQATYDVSMTEGPPAQEWQNLFVVQS